MRACWTSYRRRAPVYGSGFRGSGTRHTTGRSRWSSRTAARRRAPRPWSGSATSSQPASGWVGSTGCRLRARWPTASTGGSAATGDSSRAGVTNTVGAPNEARPAPSTGFYCPIMGRPVPYTGRNGTLRRGALYHRLCIDNHLWVLATLGTDLSTTLSRCGSGCSIGWVMGCGAGGSVGSVGRLRSDALPLSGVSQANFEGLRQRDKGRN